MNGDNELLAQYINGQDELLQKIQQVLELDSRVLAAWQNDPWEGNYSYIPRLSVVLVVSQEDFDLLADLEVRKQYLQGAGPPLLYSVHEPMLYTHYNYPNLNVAYSGSIAPFVVDFTWWPRKVASIPTRAARILHDSVNLPKSDSESWLIHIREPVRFTELEPLTLDLAKTKACAWFWNSLLLDISSFGYRDRPASDTRFFGWWALQDLEKLTGITETEESECIGRPAAMKFARRLVQRGKQITDMFYTQGIGVPAINIAEQVNHLIDLVEQLAVTRETQHPESNE